MDDRWWILLCGSLLLLNLLQFRYYRRQWGLRKRLLEAEQKALRAQIRPHFIANALNSIQQLFLEGDIEKANHYLADFGDLVRATLRHTQRSVVTFAEEMELLRLYLDLESLRVDRAFEYDIQVDERIDERDVLVPSLLFQPFLENAIWHGVLPGDADGRIQVRVGLEHGFIEGVVEDNGVGRPGSGACLQKKQVERRSMGIEVTRQRLRLWSGRRSVDDLFSIEDLRDGSGKPCGTRIRLRIPLVSRQEKRCAS